MVAACSLVTLVVTAFLVNPLASLAVAAAAVLIGLTLRPVRGAVQRRSRRASASNLAFATALTELASTAQEVRIYDVEAPVQERLDRLTDETSTRLRRTRFLTLVVPAIYQGIALMMIVLALLVAYEVGVSGLASLGAVVLIMLRSLAYGQNLQQALQGLHESVPYFEGLISEQDRYRAGAVDRSGGPVDTIGNLTFEDVWFEYADGIPVLRDVSFTAEAREIIGIVGPSGAGKSTLVQLILRLRDPSGGRDHRRRARRSRVQPRGLVSPHRVRSPGGPPVRGHDRREHPFLPRTRRRRHGETRRATRPSPRRDPLHVARLRHLGR